MHSHLVGSILRGLFRSLHPVFICGLISVALGSALAEPVASNYVFTHLAGPLGGSGNVDGTGTAARFDSPCGVAVDSAGNVYVADTYNSTIRKITPGGVVTTLAGTAGVIGSTDGIRSAALFHRPGGVAIDSTGNVYLADSGNDTIRKITSLGAVTTLAGTAGVDGSADGTGAAAQFSLPSGVAVDGAGTIYVADSGNLTVRKITPGGVVTTLAGTAGVSGSADGTGQTAQFFELTSVAVDNVDNVYVADGGRIRTITQGGVVTTLSGDYGNAVGVGVDNAGNVYVANNSRSSWLNDGNTIHKITPGGGVMILAGTVSDRGSADGIGATAQFSFPRGVAVDTVGKVYVADTSNNTIRQITPGGVVTTLAGLAGGFGSADGTGVTARFYDPSSVSIDSAGNVYVADTSNDTIRKITPGGVVTTLAGLVGSSGIADGTGPAAQFSHPAGVAVDNIGNVYVADRYNKTIRKITPGDVVTTLAGSPGSLGNVDGLTRFNFPFGVAVDNTRNVYWADRLFSTICKINPDGVMTTLAGVGRPFGSGSTDGTGTDAQFSYPRGVAADSTGNVYVADTANNTIRKITPDGLVTTIAGTAGVIGSADGIGAQAQFNYPTAVAVDSAGNVYVADVGNNTIRKIAPGGVVTTVAGTTGVVGSADGLGAEAQFNYPTSVAVDRAGNLYIADSGNHAIRKGQSAGPPVMTIQPLSPTVAPGASVRLSVSASSVLGLTYQWYFNGSALGGATDSSLNLAGVSAANAGAYTVVVTNALGSVTSNQATLTVSSANPAPAAGGGAIEGWFALVLLALSATRRWATRTTAGLSCPPETR